MRKVGKAEAASFLFSGLASVLLLSAMIAGLVAESREWAIGLAVVAFAALGAHEYAFKRYLAELRDRDPR